MGSINLGMALNDAQFDEEFFAEEFSNSTQAAENAATDGTANSQATPEQASVEYQYWCVVADLNFDFQYSLQLCLNQQPNTLCEVSCDSSAQTHDRVAVNVDVATETSLTQR